MGHPHPGLLCGPRGAGCVSTLVFWGGGGAFVRRTLSWFMLWVGSSQGVEDGIPMSLNGLVLTRGLQVPVSSSQENPKYKPVGFRFAGHVCDDHQSGL